MTQQKFRHLPSDLNDQEWELVRRLLPPPAPTGKPRADDPKTINGILYVLKTGCRWEDVPPERYGSGKTCWKRFDRWQKEGVWHAIEKLLLLELNRQRKLNLTNTYLATSIRQNKKGANMRSGILASRRKKA
jgi:transposase